MNPEPSYTANVTPSRDCPVCGKRMVNSVARLERDWDGDLEIVHVDLCFAHGFYTFRPSEGLQKGL